MTWTVGAWRRRDRSNGGRATPRARWSPPLPDADSSSPVSRSSGATGCGVPRPATGDPRPARGGDMGVDLVQRVREALAVRELREVRIFGGTSFRLQDRMLVAARSGGGLLVRIDPAQHAELVARPGARQATMGAARRDMGRRGSRWIPRPWPGRVWPSGWTWRWRTTPATRGREPRTGPARPRGHERHPSADRVAAGTGPCRAGRAARRAAPDRRPAVSWRVQRPSGISISPSSLQPSCGIS